MKNTPNAEQIKALRSYAEAHGRTWKSQLHDTWMTGRYDSSDDSMNLQQVRNEFGPSWLVRFHLPKDTVKTCPNCGMSIDGHKPCGSFALAKLQALGLTNGEGAMVEGILHFLSFMTSESAPTPRHPNFSNEAVTLVTRYVKQVRREQMQYVSQLRVERGESALPASILEAR
jgi:hypothetical protein